MAVEILDVLQRGCMEDERVLPIVRGVNTIHVLEEPHHMRFAREKMRDSLAGASAARKEASSDPHRTRRLLHRSLISLQAYRDAGLDAHRAVREAKKNTHFQAMMRSSCGHLIDFLDECGLLTPRVVRIHMRTWSERPHLSWTRPEPFWPIMSRAPAAPPRASAPA